MLLRILIVAFIVAGNNGLISKKKEVKGEKKKQEH